MCELKRTVLSCNGIHCVMSIMTPIGMDTPAGNEPKHEQTDDTMTFKTDTTATSTSLASEGSTAGSSPSSSSSVGMSKQRKKKTIDMSRRFEPGELVVGIVDECSGVVVPHSDAIVDDDALTATTKKTLKSTKLTKKRKHDDNEEEEEDKEGEEIQTSSVDRRKSQRNSRKRNSKVNPAIQRSVNPSVDPDRVASSHINALVHLLQVLTEPEQSLSLHSVGLVKEEISVQPTLMKLAVGALQAMSEYILPADERSESIENGPRVVHPIVVLPESENTTNTASSIDLSASPRHYDDENSEIIRVAKSTKITTTDGITSTTTTTTTAAAIITKDRNIPTNNNNNNNPTINIINANINTSDETVVKKSKNGRILPDKIRIIGYSAGGAVAAYASMVLEGFLNCTTSSLTNETGPFVGIYGCSSSAGSGTGGVHTSASGGSSGDGSSSLRNKIKPSRRLSDSGSGLGRVECLCLGPPPCVSRTVVPRFISSILCGDDIIPRATRDNLLGARDRVIKALHAGAGEKLAIGWMMGSGWMSDLQSVTGRGLGNYAGGGHDLSALSVPGRAFYMKSRQFKQGEYHPCLLLSLCYILSILLLMISNEYIIPESFLNKVHPCKGYYVDNGVKICYGCCMKFCYQAK